VTAVLFVLRAVVLVLLWAFVIAAVVAVRSDLFGAARAAKQPARATPPAAKPAPKPKQRGRSSARRLVITGGALTGTTVPLTDSPITIGRADDSTLVLTDDYVSTHHARLLPQGETWVLEDLGSTNGTFLDRAKVTRPTPVPLGVPIRVGKTVLELRR
jgi:hypothetical protein